MILSPCLLTQGRGQMWNLPLINDLPLSRYDTWYRQSLLCRLAQDEESFSVMRSFQYFSYPQPPPQLALALGWYPDPGLWHIFDQIFTQRNWIFKEELRGKNWDPWYWFQQRQETVSLAGVLSTTFISSLASSSVQSHKISPIWSKHTQTINSGWTLLFMSPPTWLRSWVKMVIPTGHVQPGPSSLAVLYCSVSQYKLRSFRISYKTILNMLGLVSQSVS